MILYPLSPRLLELRLYCVACSSLHGKNLRTATPPAREWLLT